jgi:hypothetical protein
MTTITLTDDEREYLVDLLETACLEKHAEVRRTEFSSSLHDRLRHEETLLRRLVEKLQAAAGACQT